MTDIPTLASRCEREEPSRELDAEIARSLGWKPQSSFARPTDDGFYWDTPDGDFRPLPRYTASIDSALMLVPGGAGIKLERYWIMSVDDPVWSVELASDAMPARRFYAEDARTAALALVAAALRAREAQGASHE